MEVWLPEEISSEDWNLVIAYAHLAEGIGIEKLSRGVDEAHCCRQARTASGARWRSPREAAAQLAI
jgi:hypothetical protein